MEQGQNKINLNLVSFLNNFNFCKPVQEKYYESTIAIENFSGL